MQVIITGCGRSGTNLLLEMVRASGKYDFTKTVEDRGFFSKGILPDSYGSKIAVEWDSMTIASMLKVMEDNENLKVLFSFRHPYDVILSKVYRGRPKSMGGDNDSELVAKDGTVEVAAGYVKKSWDIYQALATKYPDKVRPVKMEHILGNVSGTVWFIAKFLRVSVNNEMKQPWKYNRNAYQNKRYHHVINKREINKWKDLKSSYNGYFENTWNNYLSRMNYQMKEQAEYFNYELI